MTVSTPHAFDLETRVEAVASNRYGATVTDRWNALNGGPNGGYALAFCLRALSNEMPFPDPLVVSASFMRPVEKGQAEIHTEMLRTGRRMATGEAQLIQGGKPAVHTVASFADLELGQGPSLVNGEPPALGPPDDLVDLAEGLSMPELTLLDRVEYRMTHKPDWLTANSDGDPKAEFWMRFKDGRDADTLSLPMLADAFAPVVVAMGALSFTVQLTAHVRARPAPGWLACRAESRFVFGGYHEEDFEIWDSEGKLVAQSRQLGLIRS